MQENQQVPALETSANNHFFNLEETEDKKRSNLRDLKESNVFGLEGEE
jgi:hypothetical protein